MTLLFPGLFLDDQKRTTATHLRNLCEAFESHARPATIKAQNRILRKCLPAARCSGRFSRARAVIFMKTIVDPYRNGQAEKSESESRENCRLFNFHLRR